MSLQLYWLPHLSIVYFTGSVVLSMEVNGLIIQAREKNSNTIYGFFTRGSDSLRPVDCMHSEVSECACSCIHCYKDPKNCSPAVIILCIAIG